jgi:predicted nucleic acid-binding protein
VSQVVADTSPLVALNQISLLGILPSIFGVVSIPEAVRDEASSVELESWIVVRRIEREIPQVVRRPDLGRGEVEAIGLALEMRADWLIVDDLPARRLATSLGIPVVGTVGLLLAAKRRGLIPTAGEPMRRLQALGFRLHPDLQRAVLTSAGERDE